MGASLIQPCRVQEEGLLGCKLLLPGDKITVRRELKVPGE
jgi:hypothetical protein